MVLIVDEVYLDTKSYTLLHISIHQPIDIIWHNHCIVTIGINLA